MPSASGHPFNLPTVIAALFPLPSSDGLGETMDASSSAMPKHLHYSSAGFEQTALVLQGGGALGSYQAGVYQALAEANLHPDWVAGISIGAINSALIAGNPPEKRVERLREFWEAVSTSPLGLPYFRSLAIPDEAAHSLLNQTRALGILLFGVAPQISSHRDFHRRCRGESIAPTRSASMMCLR